MRRRLPDINLPNYDFKYKQQIDDNTKNYYNDYYEKKLDNTYSLKDKQKIIAEAKDKGIEIIQNGGFIAKAERQAYNAPVQSTASYITKQSMINIDTNERLKELDVYLCFTIHDEIGVSVPRENAYEAMQIVEKEFLNGGRALPMKMKCDIAISDCWEGDSLTFNENHELVKENK